MHEVSTAKPQTTPEAAQQVHKAETGVGMPSLEQPISAGLLLRLQRTAGNTAVNDLLRRRGLSGMNTSGTSQAGSAAVQRLRAGSGEGSLVVQRHAEGGALTDEADLVTEIEAKETQDGGGDDGGGSSGTQEADDQAADTGGGGGGSGNSNTQDSDDQTGDSGGGGGGTNDATQDGEDQAPSETRSAKQEALDQKAATDAGTAMTMDLALSPKAMSLASAQTILTGAFGGIKTIVPGSIVILADQPACSAKYDEVCMAAKIPRPDGKAWKAGDKAKDDQAAGVTVEGFAWKGIVYVNGKTSLVTATAHEILHNNTASDFRAAMGETFNEGITETLARKATAAAGVAVPAVTAYPTQVDITATLIALVGEAAVIAAYFGGASTLKDLITTKAKGTWTQIRASAEGLQVSTVKDYLKPKA